MAQQFRFRQFPAGNPLANLLVVVAGILVISLSLALGFMVFLAIASFMIVMGVVITVRNWWYRRRFGHGHGAGHRGESHKPASHEVIEGEYREVRRED